MKMEELQDSADLSNINSDGKAGSRPEDRDRKNEMAVLDLMKTITERETEIDNLTKKLAKSERQLEKTKSYNEDLRGEISKLSSQLHKYKNVSYGNEATQVSEADIEEAYGIKPMPEWGADTAANSSGLSITESLKAAAEAEMECQQQLQDEQLDNQQGSGSDYVYDSSTGFYYHPATGYYWDPNSGLFYDYTTGTYYSYNDQTGDYDVHSRVDVSGQTQVFSATVSQAKMVKNETHVHKDGTKTKKASHVRSKLKKRKIKSSKNFKRRKSKKDNENNSGVSIVNDNKDGNGDIENVESKICGQEEAEIDAEELTETTMSNEQDGSENDSSDSLATGESEPESGPESGELTSESSSSDVEMIKFEHPPVSYDPNTNSSAFEIQLEDEMAENYPPCIRVIVEASDHLTLGSLFIVTCAGGSIGREANFGHVIEIDDLNVSKVHAQIEYDYNNCCYNLTDKGSQNGTILNGNRLSKSKSESIQHPISHCDILEIGSTKLLLHIHKGNDTCVDCEPGQVQAKLKALNPVKNDYVVLSKEERNQQRRKELKNIKKKYGLQNSQYENPGATVTNPDYCDKAHLRRKFIGSDPGIPKSERPDESRASVQSPISSSNKGHKLLAKMGWKEGQGLGKTSTGIAEPINVEMRLNQSAGLGSREGVSLSLDNVQHAGKAKRWSQARQRYNKIQTADSGQGRNEPVQYVSTTSYNQQSNPKLVSHKGNILPSSISKSSATQPTSTLGELAGGKSSLSDGNGNSEVSDSLLVNRDPYGLSDNTSTDTGSFDSQTSTQNIRQWSAKTKPTPKMSWVKGDTEQIGEVNSPSSHVPLSKDNT